MIYNGRYIIPGLLVFLVIITFPFWIGAVTGDPSEGFESRQAPEGMTCVEPGAEMRASHMQLLYEWRDDVVRRGRRTYTSETDGKTHDISLTNTCMKCHAEADVGEYKASATYCEDCHDYAGVTTFCWDCHIDPKPAEKESE